MIAAVTCAAALLAVQLAQARGRGRRSSSDSNDSGSSSNDGPPCVTDDSLTLVPESECTVPWENDDFCCQLFEELGLPDANRRQTRNIIQQWRDTEDRLICCSDAGPPPPPPEPTCLYNPAGGETGGFEVPLSTLIPSCTGASTCSVSTGVLSPLDCCAEFQNKDGTLGCPADQICCASPGSSLGIQERNVNLNQGTFRCVTDGGQCTPLEYQLVNSALCPPSDGSDQTEACPKCCATLGGVVQD